MSEKTQDVVVENGSLERALARAEEYRSVPEKDRATFGWEDQDYDFVILADEVERLRKYEAEYNGTGDLPPSK